MTPPSPTVLTTFVWAYADCARTVQALGRLAGVGFAILIGGCIVMTTAPAALTEDAFGQALICQGFESVLVVLITPYILAVHRFILLGETTASYAVALRSPRFQLLAGWLVVILLMLNAPLILDALTVSVGGAPDSGWVATDPTAALVVLPTSIVVFIFLQYLIVLLPAVSVDAPGAVWQNAVRDSQSPAALVVLASMLPLLALGLLAAAAVEITTPVSFAFGHGVVAAVLSGTLLILLVTFFAVTSARLYPVLGKRLKQTLRS